METRLNQLRQSFAAWQPSSKKRHVSVNPKEQAVKCLDHYTHQEVSKAVGRCVKMLQIWQKSPRFNICGITDIRRGIDGDFIMTIVRPRATFLTVFR